MLFSLTFLPKLTHAAARFVCDSWPTCCISCILTTFNKDDDDDDDDIARCYWIVTGNVLSAEWCKSKKISTILVYKSLSLMCGCWFHLCSPSVMSLLLSCYWCLCAWLDRNCWWRVFCGKWRSWLVCVLAPAVCSSSRKWHCQLWDKV